MLPHTGSQGQRTRLFARYNLAASFATARGALAAGPPTLAADVGLPLTTGIRLLFALFVAVAMLVAILALHLSPAVELPAAESTSSRAIDWPGRIRELVPPLGRSRQIVLRLAALFTVDALAGGLVVQHLLVHYFSVRFGVPLDVLAVLFVGASTLPALSFLIAVPLARRLGLLNTLVFTHRPSNVLLALVAVIPLFPVAALVLLARHAHDTLAGGGFWLR